MTPKAVGEVSEGIVLAHLLKQGKTVCLPFGNNQSYDLVIEKAGVFVRVQVKTARLRNGCVVFDTCSKNTITNKRAAYHGRADLFMAYCPATEKIYAIPVDECGVREVCLRVDSPRGGATSSIRWARDYEA